MAGFVSCQNGWVWWGRDNRAIRCQSRPDLILDVRTKEAFEQGHVPRSVNIPWDELVERQYELPPPEVRARRLPPPLASLKLGHNFA
mmetsp:Transcript_9247/g.18834  ORF Transcript_9247/g.18834 Transcript_9247/m.18834 type:complete len:87 (-) Transcript_9247:942-1202(-)